ncbi:MAG: mechanosensitive ion channel family protein [Candidatus Moraniibacteriota bacterium]|jgi:small-conductance mechanosensitive channel
MINRFIEGDVLDKMFWGNSVANYVDAFLYFIIALIVLFILQKIVMSKFEKFALKTATDIDDVIVEFINSIRPRLYIVLAIYIALRTLTLGDAVQNIVNVVVIVVVIFQITKSIQIVIEYVAGKISGDEDDEHAKSAAQLLSAIATIIVWIFGIMMILSNIGVNIASLIAGVGVGGIAIAFALKEILADLFASFSIYFDKPFKAGDTVKVGDDIGTIKKIGIKTTRVKARTGEELIMSNQDLTSSRVHNYKRMDDRNVKSQFIVEFDTDVEKMEQIPAKITEIINAIDNAKCSRVHLKTFGEWGFIFEFSYKIDSRDYTLYMDAQHKINIGIATMLKDIDVTVAVPEKR